MQKLISKTDKIFIAGANGMVGNAICRILKKNNYLNLLTPSRRELDFFDFIEVKNWFLKNKPSIVIIAAAKVGGILANSEYPFEFLLENLKIQNNLIEMSSFTKVKRLLFLGSSCIYPRDSIQPIKEEYLLNGFLEKTNESYAIAKIAGLKLCESLRAEYKFDAISVMPTNLYGQGDNYDPELSHVLPSLIRKFTLAKKYSKENVICWGTGKPMREFLHVDDLAEACIYLLENWDAALESSPKDNKGNSLNHLNIGSGKEISIKDLALKISKILNFKGEILWDKTKPDGTPRKILDVSKINQLGWSSSIELDDGLRKTIQEFKNEYYALL